MPSHHRLKAWQHAQRLAVAAVHVTGAFPPHEQSGLARQLRRASYAVPLNIANGASQSPGPPRRRALDAAWGALAQVQTALEIARDAAYVSPADYARLEALASETAKTLFGLMRQGERARPGPG